MRGFAEVAVLVVVEGGMERRDEYIDEMCAEGVTTAIVGERKKDVMRQVRRAIERNGVENDVKVMDSASAASVFVKEEAKVYIVDAGDCLEHAAHVLKLAEGIFERVPRRMPSRVANVCKEQTGRLLKGLLVWGHCRWKDFVPMPQSDMGDLLGMPKQSCGEGDVIGMVVWNGKGLVRCDGRRWLGEYCPPGDGSLGVRGVVEEILAKTGVLEKFGA